MASKKAVTYFFIFNLLMIFFLFLSSQYVLYAVEQRGEVIGQIGLIIDTHYAGPIESTPTYARADLLNYPLLIFIISLIGNAVLILLVRRNKSNVRSQNNS